MQCFQFGGHLGGCHVSGLSTCWDGAEEKRAAERGALCAGLGWGQKPHLLGCGNSCRSPAGQTSATRGCSQRLGGKVGAAMSVLGVSRCDFHCNMHDIQVLVSCPESLVVPADRLQGPCPPAPAHGCLSAPDPSLCLEIPPGFSFHIIDTAVPSYL